MVILLFQNSSSAFLSDEKPEVVYIGTGQYGSLPVTAEAEEILSSFITVLLPTSEIIRVIEEEKRSFVALLHITC